MLGLPMETASAAKGCVGIPKPRGQSLQEWPMKRNGKPLGEFTTFGQYRLLERGDFRLTRTENNWQITVTSGNGNEIAVIE